MIDLRRLQELDNTESSTGVIMKWYDEKEKKFIKASAFNKKKRTYHIEAITECMASEIAALLGVPVVKYRLDQGQINNKEKILVCVSDDFKHQLQVVETISGRTLLMRTDIDLQNREARYDILVRTYPHLRLSLDRMIVFDYLIDNYDRHLRNFEFCRLQDDSVILAPMFDNGSSLLADWVTEEDLSDLKNDEELFEQNILLAETQSRCFSHQHNTELRLVDKSVFDHLNMNVTSEQFSDIVFKYKDFLSPLRISLIDDLLNHRYNKLRSFASRSI